MPLADSKTSSSTPENNEIVELLPALRAFARTFFRDTDSADDLVQETLLKGLANVHQFQLGTSMKSWLFTIMRKTFYTRIKINQREMPGASDCVSHKPVHDATQEWSARGRDIAEAQRPPLVEAAGIRIAMIAATVSGSCNAQPAKPSYFK